MKWIFLLLFGLSSSLLVGQSVRVISEQQHAWGVLNGTVKLNEKLTVLYDFQFRRNDFGQSWQQLLLRSGIGYNVSDQVHVAAGYCFVNTYPYGDYRVNADFPENRIWQQIQLKQILGKTNLSHRYRLEQRFIGNSTTGEFRPFRFENRIRYMGKWTIPLHNFNGRILYANFYDEVFLNFGKNVGVNTFDQNRLGANVGYSISPKANIEVGYMNQIVQLRSLEAITNRNRFEINHTIMLTSTINF